ncbi:MAG TPA: hypothetical protein VKU02_22500 [Gemmataceae bacterium]|nr:hypothetical protein [Gemmataceae bacterium]
MKTSKQEKLKGATVIGNVNVVHRDPGTASVVGAGPSDSEGRRRLHRRQGSDTARWCAGVDRGQSFFVRVGSLGGVFVVYLIRGDGRCRIESDPGNIT